MRSNSFAINELRNPPAELWPGYFWCINDRMELEELLEQLRDMHAHDARSLCFMPVPKEMRPDVLRSEMSPAYLSEGYFEIVKAIVAECHKLGMNYWLYDEGGWPSGGATGQVYARDPIAHSPKIVVFRDSLIGPDEAYTVPPDVLCAALHTRGGWKTYLPGQTIEGLSSDSNLRVFFIRYVTHHQGNSETNNAYADLLSPKAVETFLQLTHERYAGHLGHLFGDTIRFAFTDEPSTTYTKASQLTWTDDMAEAFCQIKGYDLIPRLPELMDSIDENEAPDRAQLRIDFHDVCSRLFVERYLLPIREWCRRNGLLSGGHFGGEDEPHYNTDGGYGHILRALRALDLPGVDAIWRELFPGKRSHHFPKYASSVARQMGQPYVLTESCAAYGSGLTLAEMKWIIDQQYVRGISMAVISSYLYSTRDHFMQTWCRPQFGRFYPLWKYSASFHAYVARLGYLLSRGQPSCHTAVYYDVRSIWAGGPTQQRAIELHERLAENLLQSQCDFDFIDDDILAGQGSRIENGTLVVGPMRYDKIVVPSTDWMDESALAGVVEFVRQSGTLITVDGPLRAAGGRVTLPPALSERSGSGAGITATTIDQVSTALEPVVRLCDPCADIRVCKRTDEKVSIYFLTNEANRPVQTQVTFAEKTVPSLCDPSTGELYRYPARQTHEGTTLELKFPSLGSKAILFGCEADKTWSEFQAADAVLLETGWTVRPLCRYVVGEHNYEITELHEQPHSCELGDWRSVLGDWFSGDAEYVTEFDCTMEQAGKPARLDIGDVRYACEVEVNGHSAGRLIWKPFELELNGMLNPGKNTLKVTVTNTLANALHDPEVVQCWENKKWPRGYDVNARKFEPDSFPSGLFGPVRVLFGSYAQET
ncbi:MAG: glycosyl hydrolase [bacterium]|nr:glycosyl hydrolase [bacterium]